MNLIYILFLFFFIISILNYFYQVVTTISVMTGEFIKTSYEDKEITTKKQVIIMLIPYSNVFCVIKTFWQNFNDLR